MQTKILRPDFEKRGGLVHVVTQDACSGLILMDAFTNEDCFLETLRTGEAVYFSTSRNARWRKGEESGDTQIVKAVIVDCDGDAVLYVVEQKGSGACHTKAASCFYRLVVGGLPIMEAPRSGVKEDLPLMDAEVHESLLPVVHGLRHGEPLCRFTRDIPPKWPVNHVWVGAGDIGNITCPNCKTRAESMAGVA